MTCWSPKVPWPSVFSYQAILSSPRCGEDIHVAIAVQVRGVDRVGSVGLRGDDLLSPKVPCRRCFRTRRSCRRLRTPKDIQVTIAVEVGCVDDAGVIDLVW